VVRAMYPGSFDPVTNGHLDIVIRASNLFDHVTVGIYDAPPKNLLFKTEERVKLFQDAVQHLLNVDVKPFRGLLVDFARDIGVGLLIKGLRAGSDFEDEFEQFLMNKKLAASTESIYMMSNLEFQFLSSARVKEVAQLGGDVSDLVPPKVVEALRIKLQIDATSG